MNATTLSSEPEIEYPDSDGKPMAENNLQYEWIVTIKGNLDIIFARDPNVFVAGDNLIYPVQGKNKIRQAPDVYVALGRPKGHRGSYRVWQENGLFPQVIFEIRSPGNRPTEMARKLLFYDKYGAQEYYDYDPDRNELLGYERSGAGLYDIPEMNGFVSPRLGIRFETSGDELVLYRPDGQRFLPMVELGQRANEVEQTRRLAEQALQQAEHANAELDRMKALLRAAGIDPDKPPT